MNTDNNPKLKKGGELDAFQKAISPGDSLRIWFTPEFSGNLGSEGLEAFKDHLKLKITFITLNGDRHELSLREEIKPAATGTKILFGITADQIGKLLENFDSTEGTIIVRVLSKEEKDGEEELMDLDIETAVPLVPSIDKQYLYASDLAKNTEEIAKKDLIDVNVLKPIMKKDAMAVLFKIIEDSTSGISYQNYEKYVNRVFCDDSEDKPFNAFQKRRYLPFNDTDSYRVLKIATEAFLMLNAGVCCNFEDIGAEEDIMSHLLKLDIRFAADENTSFQTLWNDYLEKEDCIYILPYLYLIRQKFGDAGITSNWIDDLIEEELCKCNNSASGAEGLRDSCFGIVRQRLQCPLFIELLWSYWQEEGMLIQTMNAITRRFQNMKTTGKNDPLAEMEISHLRPLNNLLWGYIQDEQHRLSIIRRAYEYDHHYGIYLQGKAVPSLNSADSRTRFIESFHGLLHLTAKYYTDSANKLIEPDAFPLLNAIKELHFIIAEGMHNQYGDLPSTARIEMLMQQWILARPEFREFLPGRAAIPFTEPWMDRVASMNKLQGWTDVSPIHFDYLAKYGEQILLSIRFGDWSSQDRTQKDAALWASYFRNQIQGYIHSYKAVTGVDLTVTVTGNKVDAHSPSYHLARRLKARKNGQIPKPSQKGIPIKKGGTKKEWL